MHDRSERRTSCRAAVAAFVVAFAALAGCGEPKRPDRMTTESLAAAAGAATQADALREARAVDLPALAGADRVVISSAGPGGGARTADVAGARRVAPFVAALTPSRRAPGGGLEVATLRFFRGETPLREVWVFPDGEWGFRRPGMGWTTGRSAALVRMVRTELADDSPTLRRAAAQALPPGTADAAPVEDGDGDGHLSVLEHEAMAARLHGVWVETPDGMLAAGLNDPDRYPDVVYLFPELRGKHDELPGTGPISGAVIVALDDLATMRVLPLRTPVRFLPTDGGQLTPGFYDPRTRTFFRWRGEVRPADAEFYSFSPADDPISPVVPPARVDTTVDIPAPADADNLSPR